MPKKNPTHSFSEMVTQELTPETRELWTSMADYFIREGPEAVKIYLDAEKDRLEGNVKSLLKEFRGG